MGFALLALGIQSLWLVIYVGRLEPIPDSVPGHDAIAIALSASALLVAGRRTVRSSSRTDRPDTRTTRGTGGVLECGPRRLR